jgi:hypothetical protein
MGSTLSLQKLLTISIIANGSKQQTEVQAWIGKKR